MKLRQIYQFIIIIISSLGIEIKFLVTYVVTRFGIEHRKIDSSGSNPYGPYWWNITNTGNGCSIKLKELKLPRSPGYRYKLPRSPGYRYNKKYGIDKFNELLSVKKYDFFDVDEHFTDRINAR